MFDYVFDSHFGKIRSEFGNPWIFMGIYLESSHDLHTCCFYESRKQGKTIEGTARGVATTSG